MTVKEYFSEYTGCLVARNKCICLIYKGVSLILFPLFSQNALAAHKCLFL